MAINKPRGTEDLIGVDALTWQYMKDVADSLFVTYGFAPIEVPTFEQTDVFVHGLGTSTDVVRKEMFTALSPDAFAKVSTGGASELKAAQHLSLRPEGTAGVVRASIEHGLVAQGGQPLKVWYAGPMFRAERPQKGRLRQFHQIGVECLGAEDPATDAEVIIMFMRFIEQLGIARDSVRLIINSMGDQACRPAYRDSVSAYMHEHFDELCDECRVRADTNPLRAFDCKNDRCREVMDAAPRISDALCDDCRAHYGQVKAYLDAQGIAYEEDPRLVRGLDYYTRTVFEVQVIDGLGAQNAIGGGGRYDRLVEVSGGRPTPGIGFACGFERLVLAMQACGAELPTPVCPDVFVSVAEPECAPKAFSITQELRDNGFVVEADRQGRSLKGQFKLADKLGAAKVVIVGPDELAQGKVKLRDMGSHEEELVDCDALVDRLCELLGCDCGCDCEGEEGCCCGHGHGDEDGDGTKG